MTSSPRTPAPRPGDDGELLSAHLAGELTPAEEAALERRLAEDAELRAALEAQRAVQELFADVGAPALPDGAGERLRARLAAARAQVAGAPAPAPADETAPRPASIDEARARRRSGFRWPVAGSIAAALVAVAVVGANMLPLQGDEDAGDAGVAEVAGSGERELADADADLEEAAGADLADDGEVEGLDEAAALDEPADDRAEDTATMQAPVDDSAPVTEEALPEQGEPAPPDRPLEPLVVEDGVLLADADDAATHLQGRPETVAFLGTAGPEAAELAEAFTAALSSAPPFSDGTPPDTCLAALRAEVGAAVVPVRVEALTYQGAPVLAHTLLSATAAGGPLDEATAWLVEPGGACATRLAIVLHAPGGGTE